MQKIILDTDIGDDIDDALALAFAIMSGKIELLGVTTVFRNAAQRAEFGLAAYWRRWGRTDIPRLYMNWQDPPPIHSRLGKRRS